MGRCTLAAGGLVRVGAFGGMVFGGLVVVAFGSGMVPGTEAAAPGPYVIFANNDLGMHCMQEDYSHFMILPPFNTVQMVAFERRGSPEPIRSLDGGFSVSFSIPGNTRSADKCNFWEHSEALLGASLPADVGVTGNGMFGAMVPSGGRWEITGVPVTPVDDLGRNDPYPLATIILKRNGQEVARTQTVVPVSWEISCNLCHGDPVGTDVDNDILRDHDRLHGTSLFFQQPVKLFVLPRRPRVGRSGSAGRIDDVGGDAWGSRDAC